MAALTPNEQLGEGNNIPLNSQKALFDRFSITGRWEAAETSASWDRCLVRCLYEPLREKHTDVVRKADLEKLAQAGGIYLGTDLVDVNVLRSWYSEIAARHRKTKAHMVSLSKVLSDRCMVPYEHVFMSDQVSGVLKHAYFNPTFKKTEGVYAWDLDDEQWLDCGGNWSANIRGSVEHIVEAANEIDKMGGIQLGPFSEAVLPCCELIRHASGLDRVMFFQSGSEANEAAMVSARAVTGRSKIVFCVGQYHGWMTNTGNVTVLRGGIADKQKAYINRLDPKAIDVLRTMEPKPAAVIVEVRIYSSEDSQAAGDWFRGIVKVAHERGIFVIQDEVVTGFRYDFHGARGKFGIDSDYVSYGKSVGCGVQIGIMVCREQAALSTNLCGKKYDLMTESPLVDMQCVTRYPFIAVAGTYSRSPLALLSVTKNLTILKTYPYEAFNARVGKTIDKLNMIVKSIGVDWLAYHYFGGVWCAIIQPLGSPLAALVRCAFFKNKVFLQPFGTGINAFGFHWKDEHFDEFLEKATLAITDLKKSLKK